MTGQWQLPTKEVKSAEVANCVILTCSSACGDIGYQLWIKPYIVEKP
jgi:hypothetical protein